LIRRAHDAGDCIVIGLFILGLAICIFRNKFSDR